MTNDEYQKSIDADLARLSPEARKRMEEIVLSCLSHITTYISLAFAVASQVQLEKMRRDEGEDWKR